MQTTFDYFGVTFGCLCDYEEGESDWMSAGGVWNPGYAARVDIYELWVDGDPKKQSLFDLLQNEIADMEFQLLEELEGEIIRVTHL